MHLQHFVMVLQIKSRRLITNTGFSNPGCKIKIVNYLEYANSVSLSRDGSCQNQFSGVLEEYSDESS